jgi:CysZ protein
LTVALVGASFGFLMPWVTAALEGWVEALRGWLDSGLDWLPAFLHRALLGSLGLVAPLLGFAAALSMTLLGFLLSLAIAPPLSAPALDRIVTARERDLDAPERPPLGLLAEIWCAIRAQVHAALLAVPLLILLWLVDLIFPIAAVATVPLRCVVVSMALAWNLFDYPLTLWGVGIRERWAVINTHWKPTLGFGVAFSALFWIPCFSVLLLPVGVVSATGLLWSILLHDQALAPSIPRSSLPAARDDHPELPRSLPHPPSPDA